MPEKQFARFWMVILDNGGAPNARHASRQLAEAEAERLSAKTRQRAYVLRAVATCGPKEDIEWGQMLTDYAD